MLFIAKGFTTIFDSEVDWFINQLQYPISSWLTDRPEQIIFENQSLEKPKPAESWSVNFSFIFKSLKKPNKKIQHPVEETIQHPKEDQPFNPNRKTLRSSPVREDQKLSRRIQILEKLLNPEPSC